VKISPLDHATLARGLLLLILFVTVLRLDTLHNDFHWGYHNDEPSKVDQVKTGERNLRHPPLMLTLTNFVVNVGGFSNESQRIVEVGRFLSALSMGLALVLMADLLWVRIHPMAALGWACVAPFHAGFFEVGHYFKEDSFFLLGIALVLRCSDFFLSKQSLAGALGLGLALAFLAGTKYVGWLLVFFVVLQLLLFSQASTTLKVKCLGAFTLGLILVYGPALTRLDILQLFLKDEAGLLLSGDYGAGWQVPHGLYWKQLVDDFSLPLIVVGLSSYMVGVVILKIRGYWLMPSVILTTMFLLAWTSKYSERYLLPVLLMVMAMIIAGPVLMVLVIFKKWPQLKFKSLALGLAVFVPSLFLFKDNVSDFTQCYEGFQKDSRKELVQWVKTNLKSEQVVLAQDTLAKFYEPELSKKVWSSYFVADLGTWEELRALGVTHVIISFDVYHRYVNLKRQMKQQESAEFVRRRQFYLKALSEGRVLWSSPNHNPKALHPGLKLIALNPE